MMFLESSFFPFPSEVAMIPAGFLAARGRMDPWLAVLAGVLGSLLGAYFNYWLARVVGVPVLRRYGKFLLFDERKLERSSEIFRRHGEIATFVCRLIPVVRQYISLPAGIAGMNLFRFGFYTALGAGIWVAILTCFGYLVGEAVTEVETNPNWRFFKEKWAEYEAPIYAAVGAGLAAVVAAYVLISRRRRKRSAEPTGPVAPPS
jgi:membrane protein DedA with SNARE-associated domain